MKHTAPNSVILSELLTRRDLSNPLLPPPPLSSCILETIFRLLVLFWTDTSIDGDPGAKAVIHFSGVLGIHPYKLTLRTAYDYTPYLSALIWVGRLVILEYALPSRAYKFVGPSSPGTRDISRSGVKAPQRDPAKVSPTRHLRASWVFHRASPTWQSYSKAGRCENKYLLVA